jgi:Na+/H+ antiporter NhaD/arsenite permease-like protein
VFTTLVFVLTYVAFSVGRIPGLRTDRLAAAIIGAVLLVAFGALTFDEAQAAVDGRTLGLLFGMMVLSAALEVSGTFALAGWYVTRKARSPLALLIAVSSVAAVLSAFLINDVVCVAFTPLVLQIAKSVQRDARPYLLALATSSNIGSVATVTGNPQNILIASLSHVPYGRFAMALGPVAIGALVANVAIIWFLHRRDLGPAFGERPAAPKPEIFQRWVWKSSALTLGVLAAFLFGFPPSLAALLGASMMLVTRAVDPRRLYARVDWPLLALFSGLFIVVAGIEKAGLARWLLEALSPIRPESVWGLTAVTTILSNLVSNVPAVMVMKGLVPHLPDPEGSWLVLAMASTLAGNLTLPGSLATIIVVERARDETHISFVDFLRVGFPSAVVGLLLGAARLAWIQ